MQTVLAHMLQLQHTFCWLIRPSSLVCTCISRSAEGISSYCNIDEALNVKLAVNLRHHPTSQHACLKDHHLIHSGPSVGFDVEAQPWYIELRFKTPLEVYCFCVPGTDVNHINPGLHINPGQTTNGYASEAPLLNWNMTEGCLGTALPTCNSAAHSHTACSLPDTPAYGQQSVMLCMPLQSMLMLAGCI